ncbi:Valine--tRNA ligase [Thalassoglobus neptunius]|uniref:Valine--tRNA ligase n=1 Tax=Thalassoglobus neptunius TaxID=1938619 RepID=A0A5C5W8P0_9PLAN|nr:valine--tRNA ligase [Thalassoglobus neptunius]TWT46974.1 Valine--tRNA ligase [Thalassoglobus neptunius]
MSELPKLYDPQSAQNSWFPYWEQRGDFNADPTPDKESHTIMIPLPNVTGALHMGHALNGTCQDLITRWRRMQGFEALWMPGTDHAGIATQAVVERRMLEEEGLTRHDVGREALVNRIWRWKDAYEKRIISQQKSLGASCDWRRLRFTLDEVCAKAVRRTFFKMFRDGLIYRGKRLVNWDVHLQTAVADDEVFEEEIDGYFWTFNYPVVDAQGNPTGELIHYSTTRPETMLGDTAVCVHPTDERYTSLIGKHVKIPLNGRVIPIIADALLADKEKGTGAVKVTPAHDPNDYACYLRNPEIGVINILNSDGTLNENGGEWEGIDRLEARHHVIERMGELGHYEGVEDRKIPLKHSDRSKTPVEPYLSDQWFVRMTDDEDGKPGLAQKAIDAVEDGRVRFFPSRYTKTYTDWLAEKRDWCISRQLWWGHRIPVWSAVETPETRAIVETFGEFSDDGNVPLKSEFSEFLYCATFTDGNDGTNRILFCVDEGHEDIEQKLQAAGFEQDSDVLDTWFSSALWPHATLGWPDRQHNPPMDENEIAKQTNLAPDESSGVKSESSGAKPESSGANSNGGNNAVLDYFYPGSVLITSRDIITLWVARMVLTGLYNMDDIPFRHVHVHPKILDGFGQTMSKSKGNGVDPVDLIGKYGADAVRFTIASFAGETQDVRLPISYECPHCEEMISPKQYRLETSSVVVPSTLKGEFPVPQGAPKPTMVCTNKKCKKQSQFTTPLYDPDPDPDVPVAKMVSERFEYGRNFCNKFWNAARFAIMNLEASDNGPAYSPAEVTDDQLQLEDRWVLSRLSTVANQMDEYLGRYQFDAATRAIRDFTWNEFCDWYLEMIKPRLRNENQRAVAQRVLLVVLDSLVRLLQPFTPFICEELWQRLKEIAPERALPVGEESADGKVLEVRPVADACIVASWPKIPTTWQDAALEKRFERLQETIAAVRNVRAVYSIPPGTSVKLRMRASAEVASDMESVSSQFDNLAKAVLEAAGADVERPKGAASFSLGDADGFIPLEGLIDTEEELKRQQKRAEEIRKHIKGAESKLANENFTSRAPEQVVNDVRETLESNKKQLESIEEIIRDLS